MEAIKLMISEEQEEMFLKQFYQIATKAIEKAQENAGMTREYLNQKEMAEYLNVSENFLKNATSNFSSTINSSIAVPSPFIHVPSSIVITFLVFLIASIIFSLSNGFKNLAFIT